MRKIVIVIVLAGLAWYGWGKIHGGASAPSKDQVASAVRAFVETQAAQECSGTSTTEAINIESVGSFNEGAAGFPVYGDYSTTCRKGVVSSTYSQQPGSKAPFLYVRRSANGYEAFVPAILEQAQKQMEESLRKSLGTVH